MVGATVSEVKAKVLKSDQEAREKRRKKERREKEATVKENGEGQAAGVLEGNRGGMSAMGSMSSPCAIDGVGEMGGMGSTGGVGGIGSGGGGGGGESPRSEPVTETFDSLDTDYEDRLQDRSSILGFRGDPASIDGTCNALRCCGCARRCDVLCIYVGQWQWTWQVSLPLLHPIIPVLTHLFLFLPLPPSRTIWHRASCVCVQSHYKYRRSESTKTVRHIPSRVERTFPEAHVASLRHLSGEERGHAVFTVGDGRV